MDIKLNMYYEEEDLFMGYSCHSGLFVFYLTQSFPIGAYPGQHNSRKVEIKQMVVVLMWWGKIFRLSELLKFRENMIQKEEHQSLHIHPSQLFSASRNACVQTIFPKNPPECNIQWMKEFSIISKSCSVFELLEKSLMFPLEGKAIMKE